MAEKTEPPTVRIDDAGTRTVREDGEEIRDPLLGAELVVSAAPLPKVTKTQARAAVNLRVSGAGYDRIAEILDYKDAASARRVVEETLANAFPEESRESLRRLTQARIEGLMHKIAGKTEPMIPMLDDAGRPMKTSSGEIVRESNPEQLAHVKVMADLTSRLARIQGVEQTEVLIAPSSEAYAAMLKQALAAHREGGPQEADPFSEEYLDAEEVDPEEGELDA